MFSTVRVARLSLEGRAADARKAPGMNTTTTVRRLFLASMLLVTTVAHGQTPSLLQTITLRSGNGVIGGTDTQINMLAGPGNAPFAAPFTATDFTSASAGPPAFVIPNDPAWLSSLPTDPAAQWIATQPSGFGQGSALFAMDFNVTVSSAITLATITIDYACDNYIGSSIAPGLYLNGAALSGNTFLPACASTGCAAFFAPQSVTRSDLAMSLVPGPNSLHIYLNDGGVTAGLLFSATIDIFGFPGPEYQTNVSNAATLDVDGVQGSSFAPATVTVSIGTTFTVGMSSWNVGQPWDLGVGSAPLIPASAGALVSSDGQIVNLDLADPTLDVWFDVLQGPTWGVATWGVPVTSVTIPLSIPMATTLSAQMIVADPNTPSGISLSQPVRLVVQ